jgi:petrobactin synthase
MLRVHCLLDCLAYAFQTEDHKEYRPLYFGVWDEPFGIDSEGKLVYNTNRLAIDQLRFFEEIYGKFGLYLDDIHQCKEHANQLSFNGNYLIAQVDLFYLPYPNKC